LGSLEGIKPLLPPVLRLPQSATTVRHPCSFAPWRRSSKGASVLILQVRLLITVSTLTEEPFLFVVGEKEFKIHPSVMKASSEPLNSLMVSGMGESIDRRAVLPDIDSQTFASFCTYAYRHHFAKGTEALSLPGWGPISLPCDGLASFYCRVCRVQVTPTSTNNSYPFCGGHDLHVLRRLSVPFCTSCGANKLPTALTVELVSPVVRFCPSCVARQSMYDKLIRKRSN
jgi:hypothetical protein